MEQLIEEQFMNEELEKGRTACEAAKAHPMRGMVILLKHLPIEFNNHANESIFFSLDNISL